MCQHHLLVDNLQVAAMAKVKRKFTPRLRTLKLRDPACTAAFESKFVEKCASGLVANLVTESPEKFGGHLKSGLNIPAEGLYKKNH